MHPFRAEPGSSKNKQVSSYDIHFACVFHFCGKKILFEHNNEGSFAPAIRVKSAKSRTIFSNNIF